MSRTSGERRRNALDIAHSFGQAVRIECGGSYLPLTAAVGDQMLVVVDSSEVASNFTVGVFVTQLSLGAAWYRSVFEPWNKTRRYPGEKLSYKDYRQSDDDLNDLHQFMRVADRCPGLLLSVVTPRLSKLVLTNPGEISTHPDLGDFRNWSEPLFERLLRTCCAIGIAMDQFQNDPERWLLLHDTDVLFEPGRKCASINRLCNFISILRNGEATPIGLVTKDEVADRMVAKALLGIADIGAGGIGSGQTSWHTKYGLAENQLVGDDGDLSRKDAEIACYFGAGTVRLNKCAVSYGDRPTGGSVLQIGIAPRN